MDSYDQVMHEAILNLLSPEDLGAAAGQFDVVAEAHGPGLVPEAFYDVTHRPDGLVAVAVGCKVSGFQRTMLFMIAVRAILQVLMKMGVEAAAALAAASNFLLRNDPQGYTHIAVFLGLLDPSSRTLVYAAVDGEQPLLRRASGEMEVLPRNGAFLGAAPDLPFEVSSPIQLEPGDVLLAYTEWMVDDWGGSPEGEQNIAASLERHAAGGRAAQEVLDGVLADFDEFRPDGCRSNFVAMVIRSLA